MLKNFVVKKIILIDAETLSDGQVTQNELY